MGSVLKWKEFIRNVLLVVEANIEWIGLTFQIALMLSVAVKVAPELRIITNENEA